MIDVERWNKLQDEIARVVEERSVGLLPRKRDSKNKKDKNFRIFDIDMGLVGDGEAKLHVAFALYLKSGDARLEAQFNQAHGFALSFEIMRAAFENNRASIVCSLDFIDPTEQKDTPDAQKTQQQIRMKIDDINYIDGTINDVAIMTADRIFQFYECLRKINDLARNKKS